MKRNLEDDDNPTKRQKVDTQKSENVPVALSFTDTASQAGIAQPTITFLEHLHSQKNHMPSTGLGVFDVTYVPVHRFGMEESKLTVYGQLTATVKIFVQFVHGDQSWGDEQEKQDWLANYGKHISTCWSKCHRIVARKEHWPVLSVDVIVEAQPVLHENEAHFVIQVIKTNKEQEDALVEAPKGRPIVSGRRYSNNRDPFTYADFAGHSDKPCILFSTDINPRETNTNKALDGEEALLNWKTPTISFVANEHSRNKEELLTFTDEAREQGKIRSFGSFVNFMGDLKPSIEFQSFTAPRNALDDDEKETLAEQRTEKILDVLDHVLGKGGYKYREAVKDDRRNEDKVKLDIYDITLLRDNGDNVAKPACHEFGHMLGLGEEYYSVVAYIQPQDPTYSHHYNLVQAAFGKEIADLFARPQQEQETTSIMSHGATIRPYHYVSLWEALCRLTDGKLSPQDWKII